MFLCRSCVSFLPKFYGDLNSKDNFLSLNVRLSVRYGRALCAVCQSCSCWATLVSWDLKPWTRVGLFKELVISSMLLSSSFVDDLKPICLVASRTITYFLSTCPCSSVLAHSRTTFWDLLAILGEPPDGVSEIKFHQIYLFELPEQPFLWSYHRQLIEA